MSVLIISIFIAGLCSIIYELLISTASAYFLGDSVKQFSITIGLYMAAMGIGSYLSRLIKTNLLSKFIAIEILLGFLGGMSVPILYFCYAFTDMYSLYMVLLIVAIGTLIGLEIPLLTRIMEHYYVLKINISNVLSIDYFGALIATLLFPFILLPFLGTFKSSLFFGLINMGIGFLNLWCFREVLNIGRRRIYAIASVTVFVSLLSVFLTAPFLLKHWSNSLYEDRIVLSTQSRYQKIVLTKDKDDIRLFLNGNLQFSSIDEYRYHEALVHVPFALADKRKHILLLGGGDGLAVREMLKYPEVESITVVDLDPEIIRISTENNHLRRINQDSLQDKRVSIINRDAFIFLKETSGQFDVIIADLPDPNNISLSRLYSKEFYRFIRARLTENGTFLTQATSPYFAKRAFWSIKNTIETAALHTRPYHLYIPSFGDWGFVLASKKEINLNNIQIDVTTRYLETALLPGLFTFSKDLRHADAAPSTLDKPLVLTYYLKGWKHWN
ncbi:Spermidine synthase [hydrothermal vent metagenome]|uniref:Spermidine synthase n=1 Tax=hydrothermal vent metagenome TaxID=652676 RepID=A0A3B1CDM0_9ZZZZ